MHSGSFTDTCPAAELSSLTDVHPKREGQAGALSNPKYPNHELCELTTRAFSWGIQQSHSQERGDTSLTPDVDPATQLSGCIPVVAVNSCVPVSNTLWHTCSIHVISWHSHASERFLNNIMSHAVTMLSHNTQAQGSFWETEPCHRIYFKFST